MKKLIIYIFLIGSLGLLSEKTVAQSKADSLSLSVSGSEGNMFEDYMKGYYSQVFGVNISSIFNPELYKSIEGWLGTPYRYAGKTLDGIDCSSFVNRIYENVYCYLLTGNSADIAKQVTQVKKDKLQEGDLVFFKINKRSISHVGVYLGNDKFAHASSSKGVIISDLNHPYYRKYFVKGGRVNFLTN